ncbi:MAG: GxxExxY protein [Flavobacteriia bacterium]|jgi:GxxExxY protein
MHTTKSNLKDLVYQVNGAAIEVHKILGPGLLESVYHRCLEEELKLRNINYSSEVHIPLVYKGKNLDTNLRCDLLVENSLVLELKAVFRRIVSQKIFEPYKSFKILRSTSITLKHI